MIKPAFALLAVVVGGLCGLVTAFAEEPPAKVQIIRAVIDEVPASEASALATGTPRCFQALLAYASVSKPFLQRGAPTEERAAQFVAVQQALALCAGPEAPLSHLTAFRPDSTQGPVTGGGARP